MLGLKLNMLVKGATAIYGTEIDQDNGSITISRVNSSIDFMSIIK